jgi:hypothetical protein
MTSSSVYTVNDDDQLAIKKSNETKPMLHLFRLLGEIETTTTNTNTSTNNNKEENRNNKAAAVSSLKSAFLNEVNIIENRIIDYHTLVIHRQQPRALPPGWIALIDNTTNGDNGGSGDVYYANEITGETQWDRPTAVIKSSSSNATSKSTSIISCNNSRDNHHHYQERRGGGGDSNKQQEDIQHCQ